MLRDRQQLLTNCTWRFSSDIRWTKGSKPETLQIQPKPFRAPWIKWRRRGN